MAKVLDGIDRRAAELLARSEALLAEATGMSPSRQVPLPASIQKRSANRKLAPQRQVEVNGRIRNEPIGPYVASTYVSINATCPRRCPYLGNGCYAQAGLTVAALDRAAQRDRLSGEQVIEAEAELIDGAWKGGVPAEGARGGIDLRLHVSGDVVSQKSVRTLRGAVERFQERGGGECWSFSHRWRTIPRAVWGPIRALASVETLRDARTALLRGYAPALTVERHESARAWSWAGLTVVPCPAQTRDRTCAECRLCLDENLADRKTVIAFALHGHDQDLAVTRLRVLNS